ncbi:korC [Salmonella enterica subsp. enterica serovar Derby]|uniref:korC n=1 Tax=Escherichia coli TaxID=562 RepID=UPI0009D0540F|nr:korC [Escherichia coli]EAB3618126.1 korC [Salmonella enterica]EAT5004320.1 korC [Salmonella enterica subsp. enterica serovar Johannesburg]EBF8834613.1 korC [Salmonella enterica subsp. enterica]EBL4378737.1 korC [Salmonella enterica subsp. enterica serovar Derby]ECA8847072.1 korC [Salmonella enterica subsp. enterica serovar Anatum]ECB8593102.1 korC [Salmonella enterica subsp. enterica serovar London]EEB7580694.1 korC [Salmonella enterica subsp. enterica serovar Brandenburg]EEE5557200.1 ko
MNADTERYFSDLIEAKKFNGYTLVSGEDWQKPTVDEIQLVRGLIFLTDSQLANRLTVDKRTICKWKSGETSMVYTTWCCLCWLAGLGMPLDNIISR